jgi:hypothetical protein
VQQLSERIVKFFTIQKKLCTGVYITNRTCVAKLVFKLSQPLFNLRAQP